LSRTVGAKALAHGHQIGEPGASPIDLAVILATAPAVALVDADDVVDVIRDPAVLQRDDGVMPAGDTLRDTPSIW
jgi:hypothetical protein